MRATRTHLRKRRISSAFDVKIVGYFGKMHKNQLLCRVYW